MSEVGPGADPSAGPLQPRIDPLPREARPFQGQRAGIVTRTAANVVDFAMVSGALAGGYAIWCAVTFLLNPRKFTFPTPTFLALLGFFAILLFVYLTVSWATTGRTYGKHLLGLRVVNVRGDRLSWLEAVVRAGLCLMVPMGLYWAVVSPTNRSLQDAVLRTSVIYDWTTRARATRHAGLPA